MISKRLQGSHLLIAEDNKTNQLVVTRMIENLGATFDLAENGEEAIELFDSGQYTLALLDIEMPKKTGIDVIEHIRQVKDPANRIPIIALTAFALNEHRSKIMEAGATSIMSKPILDIDKFGQELGFCIKQNSVQPLVGMSSFNGEVLKKLNESVGDEVMSDLLGSLLQDVSKIRDAISVLDFPEDSAAIESNCHSLSSLCALVGAVELESDVKRVHGFTDSTSADEWPALRDKIATSIEVLMEDTANYKRDRQL